MFGAPRHFVALTFLLSVTTVPVAAEPIQITGGSTFLHWDGSFTGASLIGAGLIVDVDGFGGGPSLVVPGLTSFDGQFVDGNIGTPHTWSPTVNGTQYEAYLDATLNFDTGSILIPPAPDGDLPVSFSTPFTMTGRLRGTTGPLGTGSVLFDVLLFGSGTATATAFAYHPDVPLYRFNGVDYQFSAAAEPTPEPATLLLMGTGLAGAMLRRRQRAIRKITAVS